VAAFLQAWSEVYTLINPEANRKLEDKEFLEGGVDGCGSDIVPVA
jgi:hypothetical protein